MTVNDLRPCPYCGKTDQTVYSSFNGLDHYTVCRHCGGSGPVGKSREDAIVQANVRLGPGKREDGK